MDVAALLSSSPFCRLLGVTAEYRAGQFVLVLPFSPPLVGNAMLPALHGGVISALLETVALAQVAEDLKILAKPVDVSIDFLRSGRAVMSYASARIVKPGRRMVSIHAQMWQDDEDRPIAALRGHLLLAPPNESPELSPIGADRLHDGGKAIARQQRH